VSYLYLMPISGNTNRKYVDLNYAFVRITELERVILGNCWCTEFNFWLV